MKWEFEKWLVKSSGLPDDCPYKHRFWAPEIHAIGGRIYLLFTADNWIRDEYNKGGGIGSYFAFVGVADPMTSHGSPSAARPGERPPAA